jgi:hypothetical protein
LQVLFEAPVAVLAPDATHLVAAEPVQMRRATRRVSGLTPTVAASTGEAVIGTPSHWTVVTS